MKVRVRNRQVSYGESIGILLIENFVPYVPGDTANATTYPFAVRFKRVKGLSVEKMFAHDVSMYDVVKEAAIELKEEGVRAITGDCGFLAMFQKRLASELDLPIFLTSLLQIPFMSLIIGEKDEIGVVTANSVSLTPSLLEDSGIGEDLQKRLRIVGLEDDEHFYEAVFEEQGFLDTELVEKAVVQRAVNLISTYPNIKALHLECSMLPPYAKAVQEATGLPVFDYVSMINYVHSTVVKQTYHGFM
ncbi:MAG: aspartate/glutamate racemase family protein [Sphaerochaetaceae bacterium]|jgi:hypothetical protein